MSVATICNVTGDKYLSDGLLDLILKERNYRLNPIVQIIHTKFISPKNIRVLLSDGKSCVSNCQFQSEAIDRDFQQKRLDKFTVIYLDQYEVVSLPQTPEYPMLVVKELTILKPGQQLGRKLQKGERFSICTESAFSKRVPPGLSTVVRSRPPSSRRNQMMFSENCSRNCGSLMGQILFGIGMDPDYYLPYDDWNHDDDDYNLVIQRPRFCPINVLSPFTLTFTIRARVVRKSVIRTYENSNGSGKLFDFEAKDESGQIDVVAFNEDCDRFYGKVEKHKVYYISGGYLKNSNKRYCANEYQITLNSNSFIRPCYDVLQDIPKMPSFNFIPFTQINSKESGALVDVIGIIRAVGEMENVFSKKTFKQITKKDVQIVDKSMVDVSFTLWGETATEFSGTPGQSIAIKGASIMEFNGKKLSANGSTFFEVDPNIFEAIELKRWYQTQGTGQIFTALSRRPEQSINLSFISQITLGAIEDASHEMRFNICARVMRIKSSGSHFYQACGSERCFKKVVPDANNIGLFFCTKCKHVSADCQLRLKVSILLTDVTGSVWTAVFGSQAESLFGKTEAQLVELHQREPVQFQKIIHSILLRRFDLRVSARLETYNSQQRLNLSLVKVRAVDDEQTKRAKSLFRMIDAISQQLGA